MKKLTAKVKSFERFFKKYHVTLFIVFFLGIYSFLVLQVNKFINSEPGADALSAQLQTVKRLKIDQEAVDNILELEEQNIEVQSLFRQARNNPFTE